MTNSGRIAVYALETAAAGPPVARGSMIAPSFALLEPSLDPLVELHGDRANGELRVRVQLEDNNEESIEGAVLFSDPFDEGLLAVVEFDRPSAWTFIPLSDAGVTDERSAVDSAYARLADPGAAGAGPLGGRGQDWTAHPAGRGLDINQPETFPDDPPPRWPAGRPWPPLQDTNSLRVLCFFLPCCRGCPRNDRCHTPEPPPDPVHPPKWP